MNLYLPKAILSLYSNLNYLLQSPSNSTEQVSFDLGNYFSIGSGSNPYDYCMIIDGQGIQINWMNFFSLSDKNCSFLIDKS